MSASHAKRTLAVVELLPHCAAHPDVLFVRREGCPICAWWRLQPKPIPKAARVEISKRAATRHPWKSPR